MQTGPKKSYNGMPTFFGFFAAHIDECEKVAKKTGWNESTTDSYFKIITEKIIPNLANHDYRAILDYSKADYERALRQIERQGRGKQDSEFAPYTEATLKKYRFLIRAVVTVAIRYGLSRNVFSESEDKDVQEEQIKKENRFIVPKSLTVAQEIAVAKYLKANLKKEGQIVALYLMYALGLRNAEACGVSFSHIREMEDYPGNYYLIVPQTTNISENTTKLGGKSSNAPRGIPLPNNMVEVLFDIQKYRENELRQMREDDANFENLPIACRDKRYTCRCGAAEVTEAGRKMFQKIGMRQDELCAVGEELYKAAAAAEETDIDNVFLLYEKDPTSYLLRRNFATHMMILGLTEAEMMYTIGHEITDQYVDRRDYTDERMLMGIKEKLDRRPVLNKIAVSDSQELRAGRTISFSQTTSQNVRISKEQFKKIHLEVTANEPGDNIQVKTKIRNQGFLVKREYGTHIEPYPKQFPRVINILGIYHKAFQKALSEEQQVEIGDGLAKK